MLDELRGAPMSVLVFLFYLEIALAVVAMVIVAIRAFGPSSARKRLVDWSRKMDRILPHQH